MDADNLQGLRTFGGVLIYDASPLFSDKNTNIFSVIVSMTSKSSDEITSTNRSELRVTGWARKWLRRQTLYANKDSFYILIRVKAMRVNKEKEKMAYFMIIKQNCFVKKT